ncbi:hypothetical protein TWF173_010589 [Orbilia oligospora]|uniref:Triacylglycerol lipase n=1 Tax=Orbilia oligospora TaxID=2813651 RepID=A0A7C8R726_ORBOL|nr:hypothetical protein TWF970_010658 [Orbilia oligospora]KAF3309790.1 hypothetical protein TWF173_010589 [Orbilia oligospora]
MMRHRRPDYYHTLSRGFLWSRRFHNTKRIRQSYDPRIADLGRIIEDDFMKLKQHYKTPRNPIVLSHGLFGFDTLQLLPWSFIPPLQYWRGINEALQANNCKVIVTAVPASASIEKRAEALARSIERRAGGQSVNIVGCVYYGLGKIWDLALRILAELHFDDRHSMG